MENQFAQEELSRQKLYLADVAEIMKVRARGPVPLAYVRTYGCQQNVADGEKIKGQLAEMGFSFTDSPEEADFILFNTCAIREHAEDRVFGNVGALKNIKRRHPSLIIAVCGCMTEQEHVAERFRKSYPFVNIVFGTHVIHRLPEMLYAAVTDSKRVFLRGGDGQDVLEGLPIRRDGRSRAWVTVMAGCDNFCSYCIVPYVRGRERSRDPQDILKEARELVQNGCKEITLLGQNVNSYGKNLEPKVTFAQLLRMINDIDGDFRIRFMTSHPKDCTRELLETMAQCDKVAKHLHLPFQSGNDRVLKAMNRNYTREKYLSLIRYAKELMGDALSITSDIIVGFPGETYEEFQDTLSLIEEVRFTSLFTFIYSPRNGTPAARMPDPVPAEEKGRWLRELLAVQEKISAENMKKYAGKTFKCFVYGKGKLGEHSLEARTDGNLIVEFDGDESLIGSFKNITVTEPLTYVLKGRLAEEY